MGHAGFVLMGLNSLYFNGVNSYIDCGNSELYNSELLTFEFWFTPYDTAYRQTMMSKPTSGLDCDLNLDTGGGMYWQINAGVRLFSDTKLVAGNTYHVVSSVSSTNMYLYINGELDVSRSIDKPKLPNDNNLYIGNAYYWGDRPLHADVYVAAVYDVCWHESTVASRYANLSQDIIPDDCVMFYNGREIINPITDRSGSGNDGIMYNIDSSIKRIRHLKNYEEGFVRPKKTSFKDQTGNWKRVNI